MKHSNEKDDEDSGGNFIEVGSIGAIVMLAISLPSRRKLPPDLQSLAVYFRTPDELMDFLEKIIASGQQAWPESLWFKVMNTSEDDLRD